MEDKEKDSMVCETRTAPKRLARAWMEQPGRLLGTTMVIASAGPRRAIF